MASIHTNIVRFIVPGYFFGGIGAGAFVVGSGAAILPMITGVAETSPSLTGVATTRPSFGGGTATSPIRARGLLVQTPAAACELPDFCVSCDRSNARPPKKTI